MNQTLIINETKTLLNNHFTRFKTRLIVYISFISMSQLNILIAYLSCSHSQMSYSFVSAMIHSQLIQTRVYNVLKRCEKSDKPFLLWIENENLWISKIVCTTFSINGLYKLLNLTLLQTLKKPLPKNCLDKRL